MDEKTGATTGTGKPKRKLRNYMLDRRFQMKYTLLFSGACAVMLGAMAVLLYLQMKQAERRLSTERESAKAGLRTEMDSAADAIHEEMEKSAQQLIVQQIPCVEPSCPACARAIGDIETHGSGAACDIEACRPFCEALGARVPPPPAPAPATAPAPPPPPAPEPAAEAAPAMEPASPDAEAERQRQEERIRKIEDTVRAEMAEREAAMKADTTGRLQALDQATQDRLKGLQNADRRGFVIVLGVQIGILFVLVLTGILITHRLAGPIYRMKKLVSGIDGDHLFMGGALRKKDELKDLFDEVSAMLARLREHQGAEIAALDELIGKVRKAENPEQRNAAVGALEQFERRMKGAVEPKAGAGR